MRRTATAAALAVAITAVIGLAGCSSNSSATPASGSASDGTVRIAANNTASSLLVAVAQEQGYFDAHDVNAEVTSLADITVIPTLLGKQYDIGFSVAPMIINAASAGVGIVAISGNDTESDVPSFEVAGRDGITEASQLAGMKIGTPTLTGNINLLTKAWLDSEGVDPSTVQFIQVATPNMVDQLKAGQIDAAELQNPFISQAEGAGMPILGSVDKALGGDYVGQSFWITTSDWAKANPELAERFRAALDDAASWISANKDEAYQTVADFTKVSVDVAKQSPISGYGTAIAPATFSTWLDAMTKYNGFAGAVDVDSLTVAG
ncbi:ABC transporter substrate-binding protein [Herbiconiux sp. CPCC 205763]|uniref:ABC transporter substrate-binding protein n=1 Tax=Herbiconiux aconitum TaxID=2970913 RepID=A0ABT2GST2_9MICO|nr:ABC transporter substrate-binding protein [Herbiconiux aconitum]MCS5719264.1 ABC transporter substrate-binding protein [Herbiconiux aconitum]